MDSEVLARYAAVIKRLGMLEKATPLEDDDAEVETDAAALNTVVEGSDA